MPNTTKGSLPNLKTISERNHIMEHPKILNPLSPINRINSIKEEKYEENFISQKNSNTNKNPKKKVKNKINQNEDGEHSTIGSSKTQVSCSKSNNSQPEVYYLFNKYDTRTVENDELFKITPHFVNEKPTNKNKNIKLNLNINIAGNLNNSKKARPLTPKLNIITKYNSSQNCHNNNKNKLLAKNIDFKNLIYECLRNQINKNKPKSKDNESIEIKNNEVNLNKKITKNSNKIDYNLKKQSFSCKKSKILKKCKITKINYTKNETNYNTNKKIYSKNIPHSKINDSIQKIQMSKNDTIGKINNTNHNNLKNKSQRQI